MKIPTASEASNIIEAAAKINVTAHSLREALAATKSPKVALMRKDIETIASNLRMGALVIDQLLMAMERRGLVE